MCIKRGRGCYCAHAPFSNPGSATEGRSQCYATANFLWHITRLSCFLPPDNLFFSTDAPRQEEEIRKRFQQTFSRLLHYPHPLLVAAIGKQRFLEGTAMIVEGLQCRELNKQLFFKLLDIILLELFPELGEEEGKLGSSSSAV